MAASQLKEILVEWDVYNFKVYCVIGPYKRLAAYIKRRHRRIYKEAKEENICGLYFKSIPKRGGILWLPKKPTTPQDMGYLAHEVGHAVIDMAAQRGVVIDEVNDETLCYSIAHGVQRILEGCE